MKQLISIIIFISLSNQLLGQASVGQSLESRDLYTTARMYLQKQDYANSIMVYHQAIQLEPENLIYRRELAHVYYISGDMSNAEKIIHPLLKSSDADEETYQVACRIYSKMNRFEDAKEAINKGINKFPAAGMLYAEKGDLYTQQKKYKDAAAAWEKGIEKAPAFHLNYYNLTKVYFFTKRYLWAILHGEAFVNMESFSSRTEEIKKLIFEGYKHLFSDLNQMALQGKLNQYEQPKNFEQSCMNIFDNLRNVVTGGITENNLTMLRTRFLLEWNKKYASKYPFALIEHQQKFLLNGFYDCYNQWLFGRLDNEKFMTTWTQKNAALMNRFDTYFRSNKLVPKENQYYLNQ